MEISPLHVEEEYKPEITPYNGPLAYFINNANFGKEDPDNEESSNLVDLLPLARQGIALNNTFKTLFAMYLKVNALMRNGKIEPNEVFDETFGGYIPCLYVQKQTGTKSHTERVTVGNKVYPNFKVVTPVFDIIYNDDNLNTYQVLGGKFPNFDPENFDVSFLKDVIDLNLYYQGDIENTDSLRNLYDQITTDPEVLSQLYWENRKVQEIWTERRWKS
jgi:hypothetical protein